MTAADFGREAVPLVRQTLSEFQRHNSQWLAAAIAYFTLFAVAPLFIVIVEIAGFALGQHRQVLDALYAYLAHTARSDAANGIRSIVEATFSQRRSSTWAQIAGWFFFVLGAVGLFGAFQQALNTIWDVAPLKLSLLETVKNRFTSFVVVFVAALLLLVSLLLNSALSAAEAHLAHVAPFLPALAKVLDFLLSFAIVTGVFALAYEYLPDSRIRWSDVWPGALVSAILFVIGQTLLAWYLGHAGLSSTFGAFGGIVAFLIWVNYSAQIVLFGAEFTHVYARRASPFGGAGRTGSLPDR
jgi:membrane protein